MSNFEIIQKDYIIQKSDIMGDNYCVAGVYRDYKCEGDIYFVRLKLEDNPYLILWFYEAIKSDTSVIKYETKKIDNIKLCIAPRTQEELMLITSIDMYENLNLEIVDEKPLNQVLNYIDLTDKFVVTFKSFQYRFDTWAVKYIRCTLKATLLEGHVMLGVYGENSIVYPKFEHEYFCVLSDCTTQDINKILRFIYVVLYMMSYTEITAYIQDSEIIKSHVSRILEQLSNNKFIDSYKIELLNKTIK